MPAAPKHPDEIKRLASVQRTRLLGTPAEERFDRVTRLARRLFDVPMAALDVVGEDVAWLKSVQGFDGIEGLREDSYCHYTVLSEDICLINDARRDPRVLDSSYAETWVFYAGVPLHFEGQRVGALCIADVKPRRFDAEHLDALRELAALAEHEFEVAALSDAQVALAQSNEELEMKARIDVMTRVWNRGAILGLLEAELKSSSCESGLAALMIDVDNFKDVNDTYGHRAGDEVLRVLSERLRKAVRPMDSVGRYGGDEFLAILTDLSDPQAADVSRRMCQAVAATPVRFETNAIPVSCSIGYAMAHPSDSADSLVNRADRALHSAKAAGRNRVEIDQVT
jgi:diguanylate cyclase (GGDEF)-like protein